MPQENYYTLLGIQSTSSQEELTQAFHRLARQYHPDLNPHDSEADERFKQINEAYQTLSDPERRAQYDLELANAQASPRSASASPGSAEDAPFVVRKSVSIQTADLDAALGDLSSELGSAASAVADELRGALRDFASQLDQIARTARDNQANQARRQGFPPPQRNVGVPRSARPPQSGRPPNPKKP